MYALFEGMLDFSPVRELTVGIEVPPPVVPVEADEELVTLSVGALTIPTTEGFLLCREYSSCAVYVLVSSSAQF